MPREDQNAFLSVLGEVDRPGQAVRNLLKGRVGGAARQVGQLGLNLVDALLPGDWLPNDLATDEDYISGSDLVGVTEPGVGKFLTDIVVGTLTDPLSLLTGGASTAAATAGRAALKVGIPFTKIAREIPGSARALAAVGDVAKGAYGGLPKGVRDAASKVAEKTRLTFDRPRFAAQENSALLREGENAAGLLNQVGQADVGRLVKMLPTSGLRQAAFDVANNLKGTKPGEYGALLPGSEAANPLLDLIPKDSGAPLSDIPRTQPAEAYLKIKAEGSARGRVAPIDQGVGIKGVTSPDLAGNVLDTVAKDPARMWDQVFGPNYANIAARETLEQAYPLLPTDPQYASGIAVFNSRFVSGLGKAKRYGPERLPPSPSELPRDPIGGVPVDPIRALTKLHSSGGEPIAMRAAPATGTFDTVEGHMARYAKRIDTMPLADAEKAQLKAFWSEALPHVQEQYARDVQGGVFWRRPGFDPLREMPADYVQRRFTGLLSDDDVARLGNPNALNERTLKGGQAVADFLNKEKDVSLDRDIGSALSHRVEQDARMVKSATVGKGLIERYAKQADEKIFNAKGDVDNIGLSEAEAHALVARGKTLADAEFRTATNSIIKQIAKASPYTDDATMLRNAMNGLAPRGAATAFLARALKEFKPYAVYGAFIPQIGKSVRNAISGLFQVGAESSARGQFADTAKNLPGVLFGSMMDGVEKLTGARIGANEFADIEKAMQAAKGDPGRALGLIQDPMMREAVANGVIDNGFVTAEMLVKASNRLGWQKWLTQARDWPAVFFKGVEQRMRFGLYKGLREGEKLSPQEASRITGETLYDYTVRTNENRLARDLIPFFQFQAKAIPQTAKFIAEKPIAGVALAQGLGQEAGPVYPWMEGKTNIPIGQDEQGNSQYLTGTGLPFESLNMIPSSFRDVKKSIVGSANPLLKSGLGAVFGQDPYFETPYGHYDKIPGIGSAGDIGRAYNQAAGAGLIQPLDAPLRSVGRLIDDRTSIGDKALNFLTGASIASVDPTIARQKKLQQQLTDNPEIEQYRGFYSRSADPQTKQLLQEYQDEKNKARQRRQGQLVP